VAYRRGADLRRRARFPTPRIHPGDRALSDYRFWRGFGYPIGVRRPGRLVDFFGTAWASSGIVVALVMREALR